jgi:hypothetical protein
MLERTQMLKQMYATTNSFYQKIGMLQRTVFVNKISMLERTQMLQRTVFISKIRILQQRYYNERERILLADVARACA